MQIYLHGSKDVNRENFSSHISVVVVILIKKHLYDLIFNNFQRNNSIQIIRKIEE